MINKKEYASLLINGVQIETAAKAVLYMITELGLTPTTDINQLKDEFKANLFSKLVAVDKGVKMQYEMHKTDKAKMDLINRTVSIDGYEEIAELEKLIKSYESNFISRGHYLKQVSITPQSFLVKYNGSIETAFSGKVIDVTETQLYKELKTVADTLNDLYKRGVINEYAFSNGFYRILERLLPANGFTKTVEVNESAIHYYLKKKD